MSEEKDPKGYVLDDFYLPTPRALDCELTELLREIRGLFDNCPLWLCINEMILPPFYDSLYKKREQISADCPALILIDSPGGDARTAYRLARLFNRRGGFIALVPRYAKSAATLLSLGAVRIYMGFDAELGPLDVQIQDTDRENVISALDEVHTLERLNAAALEILDQTMFILYMRTRKRFESLLPLSLEYTASILKPLIKNIDAVHYTQMSRTLQVAEQYAIRLLSSGEFPTSIAGHLVEQYPEHGFVIDSDEARRIGLRVPVLSEELSRIFDSLIPHIETEEPIVGQFKEVESDSSEISANEGEDCTHDTEHPSSSGDGHRPVEGE